MNIFNEQISISRACMLSYKRQLLFLFLNLYICHIMPLDKLQIMQYITSFVSCFILFQCQSMFIPLIIVDHLCSVHEAIQTYISAPRHYTIKCYDLDITATADNVGVFCLSLCYGLPVRDYQMKTRRGNT